MDQCSTEGNSSYASLEWQLVCRAASLPALFSICFKACSKLECKVWGSFTLIRHTLARWQQWSLCWPVSCNMANIASILQAYRLNCAVSHTQHRFLNSDLSSSVQLTILVHSSVCRAALMRARSECLSMELSASVSRRQDECQFEQHQEQHFQLLSTP